MMKSTTVWKIFACLCVVIAGVIGALQQPSLKPVLSSLPTVSPPNRNYRTAVKESIHENSAEDLTFRFIRQINHTDSICLYTFLGNGKLYYNEAFLSDAPIVSLNHKWIVVFSANAEPDNLKQPISQMTINGGTSVNHQIYSLVGGFINDPSINLLAITFMNGTTTTIDVAPNQRLYVYAKVSNNAQNVGIRSIQPYGHQS